MTSTGMHPTVAMPNEEATKAKELWEKQTNPDLGSTQKILQTINFKLGNFDDENRSFRAIASTPLADRQGDTIEQAGWVLDNFIKNPVIPWAHCYYELPVARATEIGVVDGNLQMTVQFPAEGIYDFADTVWQMYRNQFMFAFSVGFIPLEYDGNWEDGYNFTKCELLEVSAVPVPANAGALVLAAKSGVMDEKQAKQMVDKMKLGLKNLEEFVGKKSAVKKDAALKDKVTEDKPLTLKDLRTVLEEILAEKDEESANEDDEKAKGLTNNDDVVDTDNMSVKSGASISAANKDKIKAVIDGLMECSDHMKAHADALNELYNVGADSDDDAQNDDPDADNDQDGKDKGKSIDNSKPVAKEADQEAEVKPADDDEESDGGAEHEEVEEAKVEEDKSEEESEKVEEEASDEDEESKDDESEEAEDEEKASEDKVEEKSAEDLVDDEDLSEEDIAKIVAAVQEELDKEEQ